MQSARPPIVAALIALVAAGPASAGPEAATAQETLRRFEFSEPHMGTLFRIVLYADDEGRAAKGARAAFARVSELDGRFSDYRDDSELNRLSHSPPGRAVAVSGDLLKILLRAQEVSRLSDGAFDVTAGPLVQLWRRARRRGELPSAERIADARVRVGFGKLKIDATTRTARLAVAGMQLDLGGIAKGYAADAALEVLRGQGIGRALIAAGGDIATGEPPPGEAAWPIDVAMLAQAERIGLRAAAVSTSGDAEQYVEIAGTRYSHIVDPRSGRALSGRRAVSVTGLDATTTDALATALSVLDQAAGVALIARIDGAAALVEHDTGGAVKRWATPGWPFPDRQPTVQHWSPRE